MRFLEGHLRSEVTMPPPTVGCEMDGDTDLNSGIVLPLWHCPFAGCEQCWQSREGQKSYEMSWWQHVYNPTGHKDLLMKALKFIDERFLSVEGVELQELLFALLIGVMTRKERANP